jgi:peroxiredoxin
MKKKQAPVAVEEYVEAVEQVADIEKGDTMSSPQVDAAAPLWELKDQNEKVVRLQDYIGKKNVVLSFHPLAWTDLCAQQMQALDAHHDKFATYDAVGFGINVDSVPSKKAWARSLHITKTSLPSDFWPHGGVAQLYGVFNQHYGFSDRAVVIINKEGIITYRKVNPIGQLPEMSEVMEALRACAAAEKTPVGV